MAKRHKRTQNLTDAQAAALTASVAKLHSEIAFLMADIKPMSPHYVALIELSTALQRVVVQTTDEDPPWMQPRIWKG